MVLPARAARRLQIPIVAAATMFLMGAAAHAQWLNIPLPGTPRTPDGKPNLAAPAPRTPDGKPDLSGIWHAADNSFVENIRSEERRVGKECRSRRSPYH